MKIQKTELWNFRNYDWLTLEPGEGINIFFGRNGSGKTNLLEAIHYCALGKSHRINNDLNAVRIGEKEASCSVTVLSGNHLKNEIQVRLQPGEAGKKSVWIDQSRIRRFSDLMGVLRCVIFSPEDLGMIRGGPSLRRRFLDMMISQLSRPYFIALQQYRTAMDQRNAILKDCRIRGTRPDDMITDFEEAMAAAGAKIFETRSQYIEMLSSSGLETYHRLSGQEKEDFHIGYHCSFKNAENPEEEMVRQLRSSREDDQRFGFTSCGPHRDDLNMTLNKKDLRLFASQGQVRTAALSVKLSQLNVLHEAGGERPVLLLDDVMSELDRNRRMNLLREIEDTQTFITCSDETDLEDLSNCRTCLVSNVDGIAQITETNPGIIMPAPIMTEPDFS